MTQETWLPEDARWMQVALQHGARHLGQAAPNTSVGAVLVKNGRLLAAATTGRGGRPHAETQALAAAGEAARGATAYVTLEPCAHTGKTPPCAEALIAAGIARVVIAVTDLDGRVSGKGTAMLRAAGIAVVMAPELWRAAAAEQHRGFFRHRTAHLPYIALKLATGLDGAVATSAGESRWITGSEARRHGHLLRARYDAILTGSGTLMADDPQLTCRLEGMAEASPIRVLLDTQLRLAPEAALLKDAMQPLWLLTGAAALSEQEEKAARLRASGVEIMPARMECDHLDLGDVALRLAARGITRLLVEAGPRLTAAFLESGLAERVYWYRAPLVLGRGARHGMQPALSPLLDQIPRWRCESRQALGADMLETYAVPNLAQIGTTT